MKTRNAGGSRALMMVVLAVWSCSCNRQGMLDKGGSTDGTLWTSERIHDWYGSQPWLVGSNFIPSTAINPIEMWQEGTYDRETIDRELGFAEGMGMNTMRVFLHYLVWKEEGGAYLERIDDFLQMAEKNRIGIMFVFFDDCWDPFPSYGKQRDPVPMVHNSGWVQCPGWEILSDSGGHEQLRPYVQQILERFDGDKRVLAWDLYNEPGNLNRISYRDPDQKPEYSLILLEKVFRWAREVDPSQPLTTGVWTGDWSDPDSLSALNRFSLGNSDFISFHCYLDPEGFREFYLPLKRYGRPVVCTEFMSRGSNGLFSALLPVMKEEKVGAYNWGLVAGRTQTIYSWESWVRDISAEAEFWHHDILRRDGTPYDASEVELIRLLTADQR
jgi:hypothetical protein